MQSASDGLLTVLPLLGLDDVTLTQLDRDGALE